MLGREAATGAVVGCDRNVGGVIRGGVRVHDGYGKVVTERRSRVRGPADHNDAIDASREQRVEMVLLPDGISAGVTEEDVDLAGAERVFSTHQDGDDESALEV